MNIFWDILIPVWAGYFMYLGLSMFSTEYERRHDNKLRWIFAILTGVTVFLIFRELGI